MVASCNHSSLPMAENCASLPCCWSTARHVSASPRKSRGFMWWIPKRWMVKFSPLKPFQMVSGIPNKLWKNGESQKDVVPFIMISVDLLTGFPNNLSCLSSDFLRDIRDIPKSPIFLGLAGWSGHDLMVKFPKNMDSKEMDTSRAAKNPYIHALYIDTYVHIYVHVVYYIYIYMYSICVDPIRYIHHKFTPFNPRRPFIWGFCSQDPAHFPWPATAACTSACNFHGDFTWFQTPEKVTHCHNIYCSSYSYRCIHENLDEIV